MTFLEFLVLHRKMNKLNELALSIPGYGVINPPSGAPTGGSTSLSKIIQGGITIAIITAFMAGLIMLIWGGISWITAGGDKQKIQNARMKIIAALLGLVLIIFSFFILNFIGGLFGITIIPSAGTGGGGGGPRKQ